MATVIKSISLPHGFFLLSFVLFYFTFLEQLGMEGKVDGSVHRGVRVASFEGSGAAAQLGIETQHSSRASFLWCSCGN